MKVICRVDLENESNNVMWIWIMKVICRVDLDNESNMSYGSG
jgi:hypothetical protein